MRYLVENADCVISFEDPSITNLEVNYYEDCDRWGVDCILEDAHGSSVPIMGLYLGDGQPLENEEEIIGLIISNFLIPLARP